MEDLETVRHLGRVTKVVGLVIEARGLQANIGSVCAVYPRGFREKIMAEVLGFRDDTMLLMPLAEYRGLAPGCPVETLEPRAVIPVGANLLGRVVDGMGKPIDGHGPIDCHEEYPLYAEPLNPLKRRRITRALSTAVKSIDGLLTLGCGQRMGIFAGSGVGKSMLMGMIARNSSADVNVIALNGETGREVNDFIEKNLGEEGLKKSVVIVATSDHLPLIRVRGAFIATAIAEYFRDRNLHVNLMMDSVTRFAMAQREIGLALGEPPTSKGYTPSVFTLLPRLLERAGNADREGSITGLYTVLVEGDDMNEPVADAVRSILDGHIVLARELAVQNHYPAVDVLASISRVMDDVTDPEQRRSAGELKSLLAIYKKAEDLINIGAYVRGSNAGIDRAVAMIERINAFLIQSDRDNVPLAESRRMLTALFSEPQQE
jgi:flagellum-specific ATP synthase